MKILIISILVSLMVGSSSTETKVYKPYVLGTKTSESLAVATQNISAMLVKQGFTIEGVYKPTWDSKRTVICVSSKNLIKAAQQIGGLAGFASVLRVGITQNGAEVEISYTNPYYWGNAYYGSKYPKVEAEYIAVNNAFIKTMKSYGTYTGKFYGSAKGVEEDDLRDYQYMIGMPQFDDVVVVKDFESYAVATAKIDANLKAGSTIFKKVYDIQIPGKNLKLYGIAILGEMGEKSFMPKIDIGNPKHTAFLPYELLVKDDKVYMLHGRFRIAVSFPDLTMATFSKIMSTPGDIEKVMKLVCK
ncbi:MAG: hypothetical protein AUJ98_04995 [Bacteroidetes bacterium CG2_30_33_31]|nr:MAG: hypothetical protein AUJ98_04995 [Bacteroidetes bacterium CG2_30_33_31]